MIIETAHAKINFTLSVGSKRADGYHSIDSLMHSISLSDRITLTKAEAITLSVTEGEAPLGRENLMVRAAERFFEETGLSGGVSMTLAKRIPSEAGMGGGSSDAASVLVALDRLWRLGLGEARLALLGQRLGADVPVFVRGRNAWAEGVGERLTPIQLPSAWYVLASPDVHAATAALFQAPDLTRDAPPVTIAGFLSGTVLGNAFEPVLRRREPAVEAAFEALARVGTPCLTGSGSGCFVEFADHGSAEAALAALPPGMNAWLARGAERSPLLDAVEQHH